MTATAYRAAIVILLIAVATLATVTGVLLTRHTGPAAASTTSTVSTFNDGYSTAYQDMCQQGSAAACAWLHSN